jgi:hypothetical protein
MTVGFYTITWLMVFFMFLIVVLLGGIYHHMKTRQPWNGVDRRDCLNCDEIAAGCQREPHDHRN